LTIGDRVGGGRLTPRPLGGSFRRTRGNLADQSAVISGRQKHLGTRHGLLSIDRGVCRAWSARRHSGRRGVVCPLAAIPTTACSRPPQLRKLSVIFNHCRLGRWAAA